MRMKRANITLPEGLMLKAKSLGLNVSRTATLSINEAVRKLEMMEELKTAEKME